MNNDQLANLYRTMLAARFIDAVEEERTRGGEAFFHVSGAGHEGSAVLANHLSDQDWLHCHYRDKALMLARGIPIRDFFDSLYCKGQSHSLGRQMSAHMCDASRKVLSIVGPVGNSALQAVGIAAATKHRPERPVTLCSVGDGTTQQGEYLEACGEAARENAPVLFFVEDNEWAISTTTREKTFYSSSSGKLREFHGLPIHFVDGRDPVSADRELGPIVQAVRDGRPQIVVFEVDRLSNHTNADDQTIYRDDDAIRAAAEHGDPIRNLEKTLLANGWTDDDLSRVRAEVQAEVNDADEQAAFGPEPIAVHTAKQPVPVELTHASHERPGDDSEPRLNMREALGKTLDHYLETDPRVCVFGQDLEDPKGDVFGLTRGLSTKHPGRVRNAPLTESTIVGTAIGRALAGERPVAFLQFADFFPLAYNQITSELGSMHWRTGGQWQAPVIVMIACGAYRPGLGPFHAQSFEAVAAHTPGVDVFMPSTASDAVGMLNAAFQSGRPTLFFYPKSCLNNPRATTSDDVESQLVPIGRARKVRAGFDLTLVAWGNTVQVCEKTAESLESVGIEAEIIDLRSLSPWDEKAVLASAEKTARLVVVHEDNHTCGFGAEVLATVAERARVPVSLRRVTRGDVYVPCNFANQLEVLPSFKRVLEVAAELLDLDLAWIAPKKPEEGVFLVEAVGSGPADETVIVAELLVKVGDEIKQGDPLAALEATKSVFELNSPAAGILEEILVAEGDEAAVGAPLFKLRLSEEKSPRPKPITQENPGKPVLTRKTAHRKLRVPARQSKDRLWEVGLSSVVTVKGSRLVPNEELLLPGSDLTSEEIIRLTGIEQRQWVGPGENAVNMATRACRQLLDQEKLLLDDLNLVICTTTSPNTATPSMACQVLYALGDGATQTMMQAYDINAACSGYLYALQAGFDYLQSMPGGRVMLVTAEVLSPLLDPKDMDTSILFGDAASATILYGEDHFENAAARVFRPDLSARGEDSGSLVVPFPQTGYIQMNGRVVYREAVRSMVTSLNRACRRIEVRPQDLKLVIPHQANQRIMDTIEHRVGVPVFSNIRRNGNTSSSSIPLCLNEVFPDNQPGDRLGLCSFGAGFTFGAVVLEAV